MLLVPCLRGAVRKSSESNESFFPLIAQTRPAIANCLRFQGWIVQLVGFEKSGLNAVAWLIVKNELSSADPKIVKTLFDRIEAEVKPRIMPFYTCDCPRGHKGKWVLKLSLTGKRGQSVQTGRGMQVHSTSNFPISSVDMWSGCSPSGTSTIRK